MTIARHTDEKFPGNELSGTQLTHHHVIFCVVYLALVLQLTHLFAGNEDAPCLRSLVDLQITTSIMMIWLIPVHGH